MSVLWFDQCDRIFRFGFVLKDTKLLPHHSAGQGCTIITIFISVNCLLCLFIFGCFIHNKLHFSWNLEADATANIWDQTLLVARKLGRAPHLLRAWPVAQLMEMPIRITAKKAALTQVCYVSCHSHLYVNCLRRGKINVGCLSKVIWDNGCCTQKHAPSIIPECLHDRCGHTITSWQYE